MKKFVSPQKYIILRSYCILLSKSKVRSLILLRYDKQ
jgi:hypothetical protein